VIIPTYNRKEFILDAIESVLAQTFQDYELIIIDDGSTDDTVGALQKFSGKLNYFWQSNQGVSKARNTGISLARGKYIAFLDSDDMWHPRKLEYLVKTIEKYRKKDNKIALVCSSVWLIDKNGKSLRSKPIGRISNIAKYNMKDYLIRPRIFASPSNALFVSELVKQAGCFDDNIQIGEDKDLLVRLRERNRFIYLDKPLTYYREHGQSQTRLPKYEMIEKYLSDELKIIAKSSHLINDEQLLSDRKAQAHITASYWYFIYEDWQKGLDSLLLANRYNKDCLKNKNDFITNVANWGLEGALLNSTNNIEKISEYFDEVFYSNIQAKWPNGIPSSLEVKRKTKATFNHLLVCNPNVTKTKDQVKQLCLQAFTYWRYVFSPNTWKVLLRALFY
jgi:glycosyltransferase involved in cell wall biosynthesis